MEIVSSNLNLGFMKLRVPFILLSTVSVAFSIYVWFAKGDAKFGVDFLGGTVVVVRFENDIEVGKVRKVLEDGGIKDPIVQTLGTGSKEYAIRVPSAATGSETGKKVRDELSKIEGNKFEPLKEEFVGPIIGEQIRRDGVISFVLACIGILIYVSARFEFRFALGGVVALMHDVIVMTGVTIFTGREFSAATLAAVLTILGFSINDTIVVYDRIRENMEMAMRSGGDKGNKKIARLRELNIVEIMNVSVNETMSRTILTSLTVFFVVTALWVLAGGAISDMSFSLMVGVIAGTYSSIYVACAVVLLFEKNKDKPLGQLAKAKSA